ncbi:23022_t:CDS:2, partial [Gigaspora margarita]
KNVKNCNDIQVAENLNIVAIDPGIRTGWAWYSQSKGCGWFGNLDINRVFRLSLSLDDLISRTTHAPYKKRNLMKRAQTRLRYRIQNLIEECHKKVALWFLTNFDIIIIPPFNGSAIRLTSKEQKCLIDFDEISPERHDFALMLLCSRSLYRIQLKCFEHNVLNIQDICDIVQREVDRLPQLLSVIGASLEANGSYNINHHENLMMLDFCKKITNSNDPLDIIRGLLTAEQNSRSLKSSNDKKVKKMYRNLINLIDDLKKFMQNRNSTNSMNSTNSTDDSSTNLTTTSNNNNTRKRNNFRPVYFMGNYCVCTEGIPGSGEETFIHPPTALLWLPVLTNKERITQHTTSAFSLRKKTEFTKNNGPSFRPQLLRMNFVQTFGEKSRHNNNITNNSSSLQQSIQRQDSLSSSSSNSYVPVTSISAILNNNTSTCNTTTNVVNSSQPILVKPTPKRNFTSSSK